MDPRTVRCVPGRSPLRALRSTAGPRSMDRMRCVRTGLDDHGVGESSGNHGAETDEADDPDFDGAGA
ncbi:hypothetical protein [Rhodococcus rhodochrous]|uniref:hypothetical protein n=1 Tax=Rhodococcus rhodochrous TaxID=1829 RepID=UPI0012FDDC98|nr:hypothetical protein [Rhodococcus rhodochrous]